MSPLLIPFQVQIGIRLSTPTRVVPRQDLAAETLLLNKATVVYAGLTDSQRCKVSSSPTHAPQVFRCGPPSAEPWSCQHALEQTGDLGFHRLSQQLSRSLFVPGSSRDAAWLLQLPTLDLSLCLLCERTRPSFGERRKGFSSFFSYPQHWVISLTTVNQSAL